MPTTQYKGFTVPTTGSESGTWGTDLNTNFTSLVDTMLGGQQTIAVTGGSLTLTTTQSQFALTTFTGILTSNLVVTTPCLGYFAIENLCTGNYSITVQYTGAVGRSVIVPQYAVRDYVCDATNGIRARNLPAPGTLIPLAIPTSSLHPSLTGEMVLGYGQAGTQAAYPNLYTIYGGTGGNFTFPDLRGRGVYGLDNMGGSAANRITTAGSGIDGTVPNNAGGAQSTQLTTTQLPAHTHTLTDPGHAHTVALTNIIAGGNTGQVGNSGFPPGSNGGTFPTSNVGTGITMASAGTGAAFGTMNPAFVCMYAIKT